MTYDPEKHHRRSIRLPGYDYSQPGAYFVTLHTQLSEPLFGSIVGGILHPSDAGTMVAHWWTELAHKYPHVIPDEFVVMPDHFHGIIMITVGADLRVRPVDDARTDDRGERRGDHAGSPLWVARSGPTRVFARRRWVRSLRGSKR